jgi:hypothetical protein
LTKTITETSIIKTFKAIIEDHGFKDSGDSAKFEKKNSAKSVSVKGQESVAGTMSIRVRTTNKATNKKTETIFHHVSCPASIRSIVESLTF